MIVVVADDISGASEIAAVGTLYGLTAQVQTRFDPAASVDLVVVDTDTRSGSCREAHKRVATLAEHLHSVNIEWCFKKVDSVLRGHVCTELAALMKGLNKPHVILAPANPSKGRTIVKGRYLIHKKPLDETDFANDPEYPAQSCLVTDLLGDPVQVSTAETYQKQNKCIVVAETQSVEHLAQWAEHVKNGILPAGGADFFRALLDNRLQTHPAVSDAILIKTERPAFYVCGSGSDTSRQAIAAGAKRGISVCPMPETLYNKSRSKNETLIRSWADDIVAVLKQNGCAVAAITQPVIVNADLALYFRTQMAAMAKQVMSQTSIQELLIEGGATARAILDRMEWHTLNVKGEYAPGVVQMQVQEHHDQIVTIKPGSYPWPKSLWEM
jgi:uncharacterized protein YgbK (DUF1537 family)